MSINLRTERLENVCLSDKDNKYLVYVLSEKFRTVFCSEDHLELYNSRFILLEYGKCRWLYQSCFRITEFHLKVIVGFSVSQKFWQVLKKCIISRWFNSSVLMK